jgi:hypothetical protein
MDFIVGFTYAEIASVSGEGEAEILTERCTNKRHGASRKQTKRRLAERAAELDQREKALERMRARLNDRAFLMSFGVVEDFTSSD